jgi:carbamoyl-phosphate synthase large subunit
VDAPPGVLVVSTAYRAGPWACRSLRAAGYRVVGAHVGGLGAGGRSRGCPRPRRYPSPVGEPEAFLAAVADLCRRERIDAVLPGAEDTARALALAQPDLGGAVVVGPTLAQYAALCDKAELASAAARAGVEHPATCVVGAAGASGPLPALPCVVKPRISGEDIGGASPALAVATAADRDRAVAALVAAGHEAIVQERVEGAHWAVHGVRGAGRLDMLAMVLVREHPRDAGTATVQRPVAMPAPLAGAAGRLLGLVDYRGPFSLNLIERDGSFVIHDVNLRLGASVGCSIRNGLDVPRLAVDLALGRPPAPPARPRRPVAYLRLDGELAAAGDALAGRLPGEPAAVILARVAAAISSPAWLVDPAPLDPFWLGQRGAGAAAGVARAALSRKRARRPMGRM